ncbi:AbrB/MazE/SpoVT family DNA-binding domain-containing protein [Candidatus Woesearchaeota archaeon]|nr:AbrB/MazE/SpoVT family DNA-binding domain-containing protein [Candidatus Woesearchaeota archaeon]
MKRKIIQIADSTQLVSLPRKWSIKYNLKKGDEVEVEEQGNKILVSTEKGVELKSIEIDVTGLDRTTILYYLQSLYRAGYDEIRVVFNNPITMHFRANKTMNVITVIHTEVNRLIGYEIIQQKENFCVIKDLSTSSIKEFDNVFRRIFLLIKDASSDLLKGAANMNVRLIETLEEKHDSITKFISYCARLLNKYGYTDHRKTTVLYHVLISLDRLTDVIKNAGRDLLKFKQKKLDNKTIHLLSLIDSTINIYSEYFFNFDLKKAVEIYKNRNEVLNLLYQYKNKLSSDELILMGKMSHSVELLADVEVARMGIEY